MNSATKNFGRIVVRPRPFIQLWSVILILHGLLLALPHLSSPQANPQTGAVIRVLNLVYDPVTEFKDGNLLRGYFGWGDAYEMTEAYNRVITEGSGGFARFQVVETSLVDGCPPQWNGQVYTDESITGDGRDDPSPW